MPNATRARYDALQAAARAFIEGRGLDVTITTVPRPWAVEFAAAQGCTLETARRHLARAARRLRNAASSEAQWGGHRTGAGLKKRLPDE